MSYFGDDSGRARKITKYYWGNADGKAQKVAKIYRGDDNGKAELVYQAHTHFYAPYAYDYIDQTLHRTYGECSCGLDDNWTSYHSWNSGAVTTLPTCVDTGTKTYTCVYCGGTKLEVVAATGEHNYVGYTWDSSAASHCSTCSYCGAKTYDDNVNHVGCSISYYAPISTGSTHKPVYDCGYGGATQSCIDKDGDGKCDGCGATMS